ncbi:helix-turn-helix domain-containing protein [Actinokineospora enzanensis]|uniref:helix-turn-helix domain-containing protein n=1 Tax=Actinokineospora enzanensis TaxID=155975 RepID=UPI000A07B4D8
MTKLMTVDDVAEHLGITPKTVYQNWRMWEIPAFRIGGGENGPLRFKRSDIELALTRWTIGSAMTSR